MTLFRHSGKERGRRSEKNYPFRQGNTPKHTRGKSMSSLGFRRDCDHIADRPGALRPVHLKTSKSLPAPATAVHPAQKWCSVPKGFLPTLFYSTLCLLFPLFVLFNENWALVSEPYPVSTQIGFVASVGVGGLLLILANDCVAWFNMALFFHIAVEVKVLSDLMDWIDSTTKDTVLAWIAFVVIIVHLLPFLLVDHHMLLVLLAFVGALVNSTVVVLLELNVVFGLLVSVSALLLLAFSLLIAGIDCINTSMLSTLRAALANRMLVVCQSFEL